MGGCGHSPLRDVREYGRDRIPPAKTRGFRMRVLLNVVAGEFLTEARCGAVFVLGLVEHGNSGIERCAGDEVLLPGDLVGRVRLGFGTGAKADAGDAVAALDGNAVRGEGPLVGEGPAFTGRSGLRVGGARRLSPHSAWCASTRACTCGAVSFVDPGREEALSLIDVAVPGGTVVHVHGNLDVLRVLLAGGEVFDFLQAGLVGLARGHAAVDGDRAGVGDSAAARAGVEDLAGGAGAAAEEARVFPMLGVVLRVEHLDKALDFLCRRLRRFR